jgi:hypothetical protein
MVPNLIDPPPSAATIELSEKILMAQNLVAKQMELKRYAGMIMFNNKVTLYQFNKRVEGLITELLGDV